MEVVRTVQRTVRVPQRALTAHISPVKATEGLLKIGNLSQEEDKLSPTSRGGENSSPKLPHKFHTNGVAEQFSQ